MVKPLISKNVSESVNDKLTRFDEFDWELCKLVYNATRENVLISPISLKLLLAILYEGAGGATAKEIEGVLQVSPQEKGELRKRFSHILGELHEESPDYTLHFGTSTFIDKSIKPHSEFSGKLKQIYNSSIIKVPFKQPDNVVAEVNSWAKLVTHGYIEKFLSKDDISEDEVLMMANILFFKGLWQKPFDPRRTEPRVFHINSTSGIKTPFMNMFDEFYHLNATDIDAQILKLPYLGEEFSMYILLPNQKSGLNELMKKLHLGLLRNHFARLTETKVFVSLPKFSFDSHTFLKPFLQQLGIKDMFSEKADLSKIAADPHHQLAVTNILQRTGIEIEETGSTAYVITEAHLANKFGDSYHEFIADHPFVFSIEHDKGKIPVFSGKLANPTNKFSEVEAITTSPLPAPASTEAPNDNASTTVKMSAAPVAASSSAGGNGSGPANGPVNGPASAHANGPANAHANRPASGQSNASTTTEDASNVLIPAPQSQGASIAAPGSSYAAVAGGKPTASSVAPMEFLRDSSFDTNLLQAIFLAKSKENILVSPASLKMTLALLLEGAKGETAAELQDVMRLPRNVARWQEQLGNFHGGLKRDTKNVTVQSANGIFVSEGSKISHRYQSVASSNYGSSVVSVNFKDPKYVSTIVNNWVNANTRGLVDKLISSDDIDADSKMLLVNTLYFKGKWDLGFSSKTTSYRCFNTFEGKCVQTPMMETSSFFNYTQIPSLNTQVIELPYNDERYSMIIMLPHDTVSFNKLVKELPGEQLESILSTMHMKKVFVFMPRFSCEHTSHLVPILQALGLREVFSQSADLTGIFSSGEHLSVDKIVQKSKIELDEHGAVAASATGTFVIPLSSSVATFDADHPFIFFLRDRESGAILFEGILSNPQEFSESVRPSESHIQPQVANKIPPPASSVSAASKPNLAQSTDNQGTLQSLSTFMNSTQFGFYNLNQNQGANNLSGSKEKPTVAPKIPEITGNKPSSNSHVQSTKRPVVQYPESEYYQKPIPSDQDAILFSANQTNQNTNTRVQNQNTRYRLQG
nr:PREDICTED: uncharacterized protein LOC109031973 isoform X2 [Bemisia tabaci]